MTVEQLIAALEELDPKAPVVFKDVWSDQQFSVENAWEEDGQVQLF